MEKNQAELKEKSRLHHDEDVVRHGEEKFV